MDDFDDDELTLLIERLRSWLFDDPPLDAPSSIGTAHDDGRSLAPLPPTPVSDCDASPVRDDRGE